ncbi:hypothetical protein [Sphingomonas sp. M1-B02]|uniref:hypothetical protein n=1 Tax=Sphingomonas sp. M1-B02 TaxID=3114300 RepID=UPI002240545E|nr:hypothetical protein [Sphingomonas sp. S6-11]UZK66434.1 hypothetical protein OKW87_00915 [Sphingomonas sp. S6-11]
MPVEPPIPAEPTSPPAEFPGSPDPGQPTSPPPEIDVPAPDIDVPAPGPGGEPVTSPGQPMA